MSDDDRGRKCVDHLMDELMRLYNRFGQEYEMTPIEWVGSLEAMKHYIFRDCIDHVEEDERTSDE